MSSLRLAIHGKVTLVQNKHVCWEQLMWHPSLQRLRNKLYASNEKPKKTQVDASELMNKQSSTISINNYFAPAALPQKLVCNGLSWWTETYVTIWNRLLLIGLQIPIPQGPSPVVYFKLLLICSSFLGRQDTSYKSVYCMHLKCCHLQDKHFIIGEIIQSFVIHMTR